MTQKLTKIEFAKRIKEKYPEYLNVEDNLLAERILEKYPEYNKSVDTLAQQVAPANIPAAQQVAPANIPAAQQVAPANIPAAQQQTYNYQQESLENPPIIGGKVPEFAIANPYEVIADRLPPNEVSNRYILEQAKNIPQAPQIGKEQILSTGNKNYSLTPTEIAFNKYLEDKESLTKNILREYDKFTEPIKKFNIGGKEKEIFNPLVALRGLAIPGHIVSGGIENIISGYQYETEPDVKELKSIQENFPKTLGTVPQERFDRANKLEKEGEQGLIPKEYMIPVKNVLNQIGLEKFTPVLDVLSKPLTQHQYTTSIALIKALSAAMEVYFIKGIITGATKSAIGEAVKLAGLQLATEVVPQAGEVAFSPVTTGLKALGIEPERELAKAAATAGDLAGSVGVMKVIGRGQEKFSEVRNKFSEVRNKFSGVRSKFNEGQGGEFDYTEVDRILNKYKEEVKPAEPNGEIEQSLGDKYAVITATREGVGAFDHPDNIKANIKLESDLIKQYGANNVEEVVGMYKGVPQGKSFIVKGISEYDALQIGREFGQEAIITKRGNVYTDGSGYNPATGKVFTGERATKEVGYTIRPDGTTFSTEIDFAKKEGRIDPIEEKSPQMFTGDLGRNIAIGGATIGGAYGLSQLDDEDRDKALGIAALPFLGRLGEKTKGKGWEEVKLDNVGKVFAEDFKINQKNFNKFNQELLSNGKRTILLDEFNSGNIKTLRNHINSLKSSLMANKSRGDGGELAIRSQIKSSEKIINYLSKRTLFTPKQLFPEWKEFSESKELNERLHYLLKKGEDYGRSNPEQQIEWWNIKGTEIENVYGKDMLNKVSGLLASTSPVSDLRTNVRIASEYIRRVLNKENAIQSNFRIPEGSLQSVGKLLPMETKRLNNLIVATAGNNNELSKEKVNSMARALSGDQNAIVLDRHYANIFEKPYSNIFTDAERGVFPSGERYAVAEKVIRNFAKEVGLKPSDAQAKIWVGYRELAKSGEVFGVKTAGNLIKSSSGSLPDQFTSLINEKANKLGITADELKKELSLGKQSLLGIATATGLGAGAYGLSQLDEDDKDKALGLAATLPLMARLGKGKEKKITLLHFSKEKGLKEIDPKFQGTGEFGEESRGFREGMYKDSFSNFYVDAPTTKIEDIFRGKNAYEIEVPEDKIYTMSWTRESGIKEKKPSKKELLENGYLGYRIGDQVRLYDKVEAKELGGYDQIGNKYENITGENIREVFSKKEGISGEKGLREGQKSISEEVSNIDLVARERFDIPNLKKISFGGSDRDVYELPNDQVLKVAKTARGLIQNSSSADYYAENSGLIPKTIEVGKNYIVKEKVYPPNESVRAMVKDIQKNLLINYLQPYNKRISDYYDKLNKLQDKYGEENGSGLFEIGEIANYDVLINDFKAIRNWGTTKDGKAILLDEGTLNGRLIEQSKKVGGKNLSDPEFRDIYNQSRNAKKQFGDIDKKTMYGVAGALGAGALAYNKLDDEDKEKVESILKSGVGVLAIGGVLMSKGDRKIATDIIKKLGDKRPIEELNKLSDKEIIDNLRNTKEGLTNKPIEAEAPPQIKEEPIIGENPSTTKGYNKRTINSEIVDKVTQELESNRLEFNDYRRESVSNQATKEKAIKIAETMSIENLSLLKRGDIKSAEESLAYNIVAQQNVRDVVEKAKSAKTESEKISAGEDITKAVVLFGKVRALYTESARTTQSATIEINDKLLEDVKYLKEFMNTLNPNNGRIVGELLGEITYKLSPEQIDGLKIAIEELANLYENPKKLKQGETGKDLLEKVLADEKINFTPENVKKLKKSLGGITNKKATKAITELLIEHNKNPKAFDKFSYWFYNSILSNPMTDFVNITGNTFNLAFEIMPELLSLDAVKRKRVMSNIKIGYTKGIAEAKKVYNAESNEQSKFMEEMNLERRYDLHPKFKLGKAGRALLPTTRLLMEDVFFKSIAREVELSELKNKSKDLFKDRLDEIDSIIEIELDASTKGESIFNSSKLSDIQKEKVSEIIKDVNDFEKYLVFQSELGKFGKGAQAISNSNAVGKLILPFVRIGINLGKVSYSASPLGFTKLFGEKGRMLSERKREKVIRRAQLGTLFYSALGVGLASGAIQVTGKLSRDKDQNEILNNLGYKPNHIYFGEYGFNYMNITPFGYFLALIGNASDEYKYGKAEEDIQEQFGSAVLASLESVSDQGFLQGISKLTQAIRYRDGSYFEAFEVGLLPNISSFPRDVRDLVKGEKYLYEKEGYVDRIKYKIGMDDELIPKYNIWGEKSKNVYNRLPFPITKLDSKGKELDLWLHNNKLNIPKPSKNTLLGDREMTTREYGEYTRLVGLDLRKRLTDLLPELKELDREEAQEMITRESKNIKDEIKEIIQE